MLGRRADGYHELVSVFQAVSLADDLECAAAEGLTLDSEPPLPFADNLGLRAATLLRARGAVAAGARLVLRKRIPIAAGLGGGSADAAAALLGLRRLWGLGRLPLAPLAECLGSDVPYFLGTATALVRGRGEALAPLPAPPARPLLLLRPRRPLATRDIFAELRPEEWSDGRETLGLAAALSAGEALPEHLLRNGLLAAAERRCPPLAALRGALAEAGLWPHLSGSGPTLFVFPRDAAEARRARHVGRELDAEVWPCRTIRGRPLTVRRRGGP